MLEGAATLPLSPRAYHGILIHSLDSRHVEYLHDALIGVDAAGIISFIEKDVPIDRAASVLKAKGWHTAQLVKLARGDFLIPGLIDTHTHAPQYANLAYGQNYQLLDWLQQVTFPTEKKFDNLSYAKVTYESVVTRVINSGTTTCCYFGTLHLEATQCLASICHRKGQRAFVGKVCMDRHGHPGLVEKSASLSIKDTKEFIRHVRSKCSAPTIESDLVAGEYLLEPMSPGSVSSHGSSLMASAAADTSLIQPIVTPRFAISCSDSLLASLSAMITRDPTLPIQTHLSENETEVKFTKELFPFAASYTGVYDHFGLLRRNTILAHCVHLEEEEIKLIKERECGVSHCPTSNFNLRSGISPVSKLLDADIKVGLGTDISGGFSISILSAIRDASIVSKISTFYAPIDRPPSPTPSTRNRSLTPKAARQNHNHDPNNEKFSGKHLSPDTLFFLATLGGARVCCLDDRIGNFVCGKEFDALLIQTGQKSPEDVKPKLEPEHHSIEEIIDSLPERYPEGLNPALFIEPDDPIEVVFEKFLFAVSHLLDYQ